MYKNKDGHYKATGRLETVVLISTKSLQDMDAKRIRLALFLVVVVVVASTVVTASDFILSFTENGNDYKESVRVDEDRNVEEMYVPAHETRDALGLLNDFSSELTAKKFFREKVCYISKLSPEIPNPRKMKKGLKVSGGQFPKSRFTVVNVKTFPLRNMTIDEVGPNIAAFCKGYGLVLAVDFVKDNIDEELGILTRGGTGRRLRRQLGPVRIITETKNACDKTASRKAMECCYLNYNLHCKWRGRHCYYYITCHGNESVNNGNGGHVCTGVHSGVYGPRCCDYVCPRDGNGKEICD